MVDWLRAVKLETKTEKGNAMKVTWNQNKQEAIKAGIEPSPDGTLTVDVDLQTLTPEQRSLLAEGFRDSIVVGTPEEIVSVLQRRLDENAERKRQAEREQADYDARVLAAIPLLRLLETTSTIEGIQVPVWVIDQDSLPHSYNASPEVSDKYHAAIAALEAECTRKNDVALAGLESQITAARLAREAKEAAEQQQKQQAFEAELAKRLETGILQVSIERGNRSDWGEPWIAKLSTRNGRRPDYDFSQGSYDSAAEVLRIPCKPGEIIAYGQKNYRKPRRTIHEVMKMQPDGRLVSA